MEKDPIRLLDELLNILFENRDYPISFEMIGHKMEWEPSDQIGLRRILDHMKSNGHVDDYEGSGAYKITFEGIIFRHYGGYSKDLNRKNRLGWMNVNGFYLLLVTSLASVVTMGIYLVDFLERDEPQKIEIVPKQQPILPRQKESHTQESLPAQVVQSDSASMSK